MPRLSNQDLEAALATLPGWSLTDQGISKRFDLPSYADAIAAVARIGFEAEALNHHPDLAISWKRVTFTLTTHDQGGVTEKDVELARRIESLLSRF